MKVKTSEDYIEELKVLFPQIEEDELRRIVKFLTSNLSYYLRTFYRGFSFGSPAKFIVAKIFSDKHLNSMRKACRTRKVKADGKK